MEQKPINNTLNDVKLALSYAKGIMATAREPVLVLSKELRVISANRAYYSIFKRTEKETIGSYLPDIGNGQWNIPELIRLLKEILPKQTTVDDYEISHEFESIGRRDISINSCKLRVSKEVALAITEEEGEEVKEEELILLAIEDITERKKINEELRRLDQLKSEFVANVSHEFLNPLSIIEQSVEILLDGLAGKVSTKQEEILSRAKVTTARLIRLVSNLLVVSKIESGKMDVRRQRLDLCNLLEHVLIDFEKSISEKKITVQKKIPSKDCIMWGDQDRITEVLINLLSNSIKYTQKGGKISISISITKKIVRCEVADSGPGIPDEYVDKIFNKFERITAEKQSGTGLGLPIAKGIIELHKGKIWVESKPGKGSKFIFTLPRDFKKDFDCK